MEVDRVNEGGVDTSPANRRLHPRLDTRWWGDLAIGPRHVECYVYNVSLGGAKLLVFGAFRAQKQVTLFLPRVGHFRCDVRWADYPYLGIKFHERDHDRSAKLVAEALANQPFGTLPSIAEFIG